MNWQSEILLSAALTQSSFYLQDKIPLALRDNYPELAGIFDRFDDMTGELEDTADPEELRDAQRDVDRLSSNMDDMASRCAQMRDMVLTLLQMDAAAPLQAELQQLVGKADDAYEWAEAHR